MKDIIGFSGATYNTKYAMICQPMTRIDTPIAVCFLLLLFAVKIWQRLMPNERHILPHLQNAWVGAYGDYILAEQKVENIKNK